MGGVVPVAVFAGQEGAGIAGQPRHGVIGGGCHSVAVDAVQPARPGLLVDDFALVQELDDVSVELAAAEEVLVGEVGLRDGVGNV